MKIACATMHCVNLADSSSDMGSIESLRWQNGALILLDQTRLPVTESYIECRDYRRVADAIRRLEVRGAPAIGAAASYGLVLGAMEVARKGDSFETQLPVIAAELKSTRPTAVNLFWAVNRMMRIFENFRGSLSEADMVIRLENEAESIAREDRTANEKIAQYGVALFTQPASILTHCNAGALATVAVGTALGVIHRAWREGHVSGVYVDETRPLLQGARLTAFELSRQGIPVTLITDSMAAWVMKTGRFTCGQCLAQG